MKPYDQFCRAHRPMLPTSLRNAERERILGQLWRALSEAERAAKWGSPAQRTAPITASTSAALGHYPAPGPPALSQEPFPVQRPVHRVTPPDRHVASSAQQTAAADAPLADRWVGLWKAKEEAKAAAGRAPGNPHTALTAPPPALADPSGAPAAAAPAAPAAAPPAAPSAPVAVQPHVPTAPRGRRRPRRRPTVAPAAAPSAELLVLPNGTPIPCVPRLYLDPAASDSAPAPAAPAAAAAPPAELVVLPNGTIIPCSPRLYLDTLSTPAASAPASAALATAGTSNEAVPAAAESRTCPGAPASPPSRNLLIGMAWLNKQLLEERLEELTSEETVEVLFG